MLSGVEPLVAQLRGRPRLILLCAAVAIPVSLLGIYASPLVRIATRVLTTSLETRIPRVALPPTRSISGMIVLGGGTTRVREAMALSDQFPDAPVVLSGPGDKERDLAETHLANLIVDQRAANTFENALYARALLKPKDDSCWLLITSAIHMPRALGVFRAAGFPVAPWPVFDTPQSVNQQTRPVQRELFGLIAYRLLGRTRAFYPAPGEALCHAGTRSNRVHVSLAK